MLSYGDLADRWKKLRSSGLAIREVACVGAARTLLCAEFGEAHALSIALAAGVHGDEPAGPLALLELVERRELDPRYTYRIWPCTNPTGYELRTRANGDGEDVNRSFGRGGTTPEARAVITSNRDRKFMLSIDLHEDCDARGFYCYEYGIGDLGIPVVQAVADAGYPVENILRPKSTEEAQEIGGLSYTLALVRHAARRALTFETPTGLALEERVQIHRVAVKAAIAALSKGS
jgi:protein MpaA